MTMTVTDPQGNVRPDAPEAPLPWHESFRYFRISQGSEDLFDAYRNAFLALESILSTIHPPLIRAGRIPGGEGNWLKEAITHVGSNGIPLSDFVPVGVADPAGYLHRELYQQTRCGLNHAKGGLPFLLPRSEADRRHVTEGLERLARLYLRLVELQFKVTRPASVITDYGFKSIFTQVFDEMNLLVSDDEKVLEVTDEAVNPMGGAILGLPMAEPVDATNPYLVTRMFWAERRLLATLPFIRRIGGCMADGTPFILSSTQGRLVLGNARRFEVLLGMTGASFGQPKTSFTF